MKAPQRLRSLLEEGLIDSVVRQLMSGKEATVYVVRCGNEIRCAKVYKEATHRSFRQAVDYTENRKVKNSRQARAMAKGTRFGRQAQEAAWQTAEVDALHRLAAAGVRVPKPFNFHDGVLLMELVVDDEGAAAPRLNDVDFTAQEACAHHAALIGEVVRMLCAGVIHGDLSEFNILLGADGPVIIDLPQAVDAAGNNHAQRMLLRDVDNLREFFGRFDPDLLDTGSAPRSGRSTCVAFCSRTRHSAGGSKTRRDRSMWRMCCAWSAKRATRRPPVCCGCEAQAETVGVWDVRVRFANFLWLDFGRYNTPVHKACCAASSAGHAEDVITTRWVPAGFTRLLAAPCMRFHW